MRSIAAVMPPPPRAIGMTRLLPVLTLALLVAMTWGAAAALGYQFKGWSTSLAGAGVLMALAVGYGWSARSTALSDTAYFGALWIAFTGIGAISTYLAAGLNYPLLDGAFHRMDQALGFDWMVLYELTIRHAWLKNLLAVAYNSLLPQTIVAIIFLCYAGMPQRCYELWWAAVLALMATSLLSGLYPAAGTFEYYGVGLERAIHLPHLHQLRDGVSRSYVLGAMQGIITFPSFHVVMALLLTHAYRGTRLLLPIAALNSAMLLSTPVFGGHYLVDMLGGGAIAVLAAWLARALLARTDQRAGWRSDVAALFAPKRAST